MDKIGIVNCFQIKNYGSVLQSLALEYILYDLGYEGESIYYSNKKNIRDIISYLPQIFVPSIRKMKFVAIKKKLYLKLHNKQLKTLINKRNDKFLSFVNNNFHLTKCIRQYQQLPEQSKKYSAVVLGSDQVWHPINLGSHYYTLEWVQDSIPKITYASSFGVSTIPSIQCATTKRYLARLDAISVREKAGVSIVKNLIGVEPSLVADPTLLVDVNQWFSLKKNPELNEKYIFCYFLGDNESHRDLAEKLAKETGLKIVTIPFMDEIVNRDFEFGDYKLFDVDPSDFLGLIYNAEYILTDSFHGTVFSIVFKKQFLTFNRYAGKNGSTNSRIDTLLNMFNLESRRYHQDIDGSDIVNQLNQYIPYDTVETRIDELRNNSKQFLSKALRRLTNE